METKRILAAVMVLAVCMCSVCWGDPNHIHVLMPDSEGDDSGDSWANALSFSEFETNLTNNAAPGDRYYIKGGATYTLTQAINSAKDGNATNPIYILGVKAATTNEGENIVASDYAYTTARPFFDADDGAYDFIIGDFYVVRNIRTVNASTNGFRTSFACVVENCKFTSTSETAGHHAAKGGGNGSWISCEFTGGTARGFSAGAMSRLKNCYIHDSSTGVINAATTGPVILDCVFDTCTTGMDVITRYSTTIDGCTFYTCTTAITGTTGHATLFVNNVVDGSTTEANWTTSNQANGWWDYNVWDATPTLTNVTAGDNTIQSAVTLTDGANADFTLHATTGTAAMDAGLQLSANEGVKDNCDYKQNVGVDGDDNAAGGTTYNIKSANKSGGKQ